eukprot:SAG11_NODE_8540_length_1003_cov_1.671460_2_plen_96_part_00
MVKTKLVEEGGALRLCDALQDDQFPHSTAVLALISVQTDYFCPAMTSVIAKINSGHDAFLSVARLSQHANAAIRGLYVRHAHARSGYVLNLDTLD